MKKILSLLILIFSFTTISLQAQVKISRPDLSYVNNTLTIKYDITGCKTGQFVDVSLIIISSKSDTIRPGSVTGDIGTMVNCGPGKTISWNVIRDNVKIDDDIEVMLLGKENAPTVSNASALEKENVARGKVMALSAVIPGLGQKIASGKPVYLALSGVVYGAAGASALFFVQKNKYYDDYLNASGTEADELFNKSEKSYSMAKYMMFGAAGAWVANMIWSAVIPIKEKPLKKPEVSFIPGQQKELFIMAKWTF
jgi:hypothetical protein